MTPTDLPFDQIWLHDFEFVPRPGEHPDVVCLAAHELRSGQTIELWRDALADSRHTAPIAGCCSSISLQTPSVPATWRSAGRCRRMFDLSPVFRNLTNGRLTPEGKGLLGALRYFGLDTITTKERRNAEARHGRAVHTRGAATNSRFLSQRRLKTLGRLLPKILTDPKFDLAVALYHGEFAAVSASMEHMASRSTWRYSRSSR